MSENIIDFEKAKIKRMEKKFDDLTNRHIDDEEFAEDFSVSVMCDIIETMKDYGYDVRNNPDSILDIICAIEAIRSIVCRISDMDSPLHDVNKNIFGPIAEEKGSTYELLDSFLIDFEIDLD